MLGNSNAVSEDMDGVKGQMVWSIGSMFYGWYNIFLGGLFKINIQFEG